MIGIEFLKRNVKSLSLKNHSEVTTKKIVVFLDIAKVQKENEILTLSKYLRKKKYICERSCPAFTNITVINLFNIHLSQQLILTEIRNKNQKVFKKLFSDLYEELVNYANRYLFDKNSSEDIVQEVFIYLWEQAETIHIKDSLKSYLYSMVRNRSLNYLKSIKVVDSLHLLDLNTILISNYDLEAFSTSDKQIIQNQLQQIIKELPFKMQEIVRLRFISNYKYDEIADEMGISVNTVKTQLKRAKLKISASISPLLLLLLHHF